MHNILMFQYANGVVLEIITGSIHDYSINFALRSATKRNLIECHKATIKTIRGFCRGFFAGPAGTAVFSRSPSRVERHFLLVTRLQRVTVCLIWWRIYSFVKSKTFHFWFSAVLDFFISCRTKNTQPFTIGVLVLNCVSIGPSLDNRCMFAWFQNFYFLKYFYVSNIRGLIPVYFYTSTVSGEATLLTIRS